MGTHPFAIGNLLICTHAGIFLFRFLFFFSTFVFLTSLCCIINPNNWFYVSSLPLHELSCSSLFCFFSKWCHDLLNEYSAALKKA